MPYPERFVHRGVTAPEPFQGDYSRVVLINDPPFTKGEVHYRRSNLNTIGSFDIAQTFGNLQSHTRLSLYPSACINIASTTKSRSMWSRSGLIQNDKHHRRRSDVADPLEVRVLAVEVFFA